METLSGLYRIFTSSKVSSMRLLLYVFLGYSLSGSWNPLLFTLNTLIVTGGILFASLLNDYHDYRLLNEANAVSRLMGKNILSRKQVYLLIWLPWLVSLFLFIVIAFQGSTLVSLMLLWASFLMSFVYSSPPFRWKERKILGIITPPLGIFILFYQALCLIKVPSGQTMMIAVLVFIYSWYLEFLHLAEDSITEHETKKISSRNSLRALKTTCVLGILISLSMAFEYGIIFVSVAAWSLRALSVFRLSPQEIAERRKNIFSSIYRIEEFIIYAAYCIINLFLSNPDFFP